MWHRAIAPILSTALVGCVANPAITKTEHCTSLKLTGHTDQIALRSEAVHAINMLHEFPPPARFTEVSLVVPAQLAEMGVSAMYLNEAKKAYPAIGLCVPTSNSRQACRLANPELSRSGFALLLVAASSSNGAKIVETGEEYWLQVSGCK